MPLAAPDNLLAVKSVRRTIMFFSRGNVQHLPVSRQHITAVSSGTSKLHKTNGSGSERK